MGKSIIKIDDKLKARLNQIKTETETTTGKPISFSMAIDIYALKKVGIKKKNKGHPSLVMMRLPEVIIPQTPRFNEMFGD
jgi:hypothetical protein